MVGGLYMVWFDDSPKKSFDLKLEEGLAHYRKYHGEPTVMLVPEGSIINLKHPIPIEECKTVLVNNVFIGHNK